LESKLLIDKDLSEEEKYIKLVLIVKSLLSKEDHVLSNLANLTAALKQAFEKISWVGFYLMNSDGLYLGPFQGKIACTKIALGRGVCGTAALERKTIIVPDVDKFPGHIACDEDSRSEIVVPVFKNEVLYAVLDLDSSEYNAFDETDKHYLQEICSYLTSEILEGS
jgi:L-methionine (R)-S-oxide reductase